MAAPFIPSKYQSAIFDFIENSNRNLIIEAVAGSGKSKTLEEICNLPSVRRLKVLLLAFNKLIADELKGRGLPAKTFNGLGFGVLMRSFGNPRLNADKLGDTLRRLTTPDVMKRIGSQVNSMVQKAYALGVVPNHPKCANKKFEVVTYDTDQVWYDIIDRFSINFEETGVNKGGRPVVLSPEELMEEAIHYSREVMADMITNTVEVCFDDQIYMPVVYGLAVPYYDLILVDEAQDTNPIQVAFLKKMRRKNNRFVFVGDRRQAIYQFRGASHGAMDILKEEFDCGELPLSVTYRCPINVVLEARQYVQHIEWREGAPEGTVESLEKYGHTTFSSGDLIVCRNNAPLVKMMYKFIANGVPAVLLGRDVAKDLINLMRKYASNYTPRDNETEIQFIVTSMTSWKDKEVQKCNDMNNPKRAEAILDKYEVIMTIIDASEANTINDVCSQLDKLFGNPKDTKGKITLSSIHKSKGGQARRVFFLDSFLLPARWAVKPEDILAEDNLTYVAITRSMDYLAYIDSEGWVL